MKGKVLHAGPSVPENYCHHMLGIVTAVLIPLRKGLSSIAQFPHIYLTYIDKKINLLFAEQNRKNQDINLNEH